MATIELSQTHSLPVSEARQRAEDIAKSMAEKLGMDWTWTGDNIHFEAKGGVAKGTKGIIAVGDSDVKVSVDLPLMLKMMKGSIEGKIREKLERLK